MRLLKNKNMISGGIVISRTVTAPALDCRGDMIGGLALFLSTLARVVADTDSGSSTGTRPAMAFLSRHRVELAAARLLHTDQSINRVGEPVGWPDQNYLARRFKSHYGLSASLYRTRFTHANKS